MQFRKLSLLAVMLISLAGCQSSAFNMNREAGADVDEGGFGNPTMINSQTMQGSQSYTMALGKRFASEVPSTITFEFNSAELTQEARAVLSQQAAWIRQFPELRFRVYGHTDLVGSAGYNKALGLRRARAVVAYLSSQGVGSARLEAVASYGKTRPVVQTSGPEIRNRRTVTEVSGFGTTRKPTLMNGKYAAEIMNRYVKSSDSAHPANTVIATQVNPG